MYKRQHLILATQKVKKETIDTKTQENIEGKMCFKMSTIAGSVTVLGNKMAHELPAVPGRGIWSRGSEFFEVQAPFLSPAELKKELKSLESKFQRYHDAPALDAQEENDDPEGHKTTTT